MRRRILPLILLIAVIWWVSPPFLPTPSTITLHSKGLASTFDTGSPGGTELLRELRKALGSSLSTAKLAVFGETFSELRSGDLCLEIKYSSSKPVILREDGPWWPMKTVLLAPTIWIPLSEPLEGLVIVVPQSPSAKPRALGPVDTRRLKAILMSNQ